MRFVVLLVLGMVLLVVGAQGAIRVMLDQTDIGLLAPLGLGSVLTFLVYLGMAVVGALLAGWGRDRARRVGSLQD